MSKSRKARMSSLLKQFMEIGYELDYDELYGSDSDSQNLLYWMKKRESWGKARRNVRMYLAVRQYRGYYPKSILQYCFKANLDLAAKLDEASNAMDRDSIACLKHIKFTNRKEGWFLLSQVKDVLDGLT